MVAATSRPARVRIDLGAVRRNVERLARAVAPAEVCAVVKADAYGHGAIPAARAAIAGGATWLAVAVVDEGLALRSSGIEAPILLLSEPPVAAMADAHGGWLTPTLYTSSGVAAAAAVASTGRRPWPVHLKVDTGMHRVGAAPDVVAALVAEVVAHPMLEFDGLWTHLAVADEVDHPFTGEQLRRFGSVLDELGPAGRPRLLHVANSAGAVAHPAARFDLVRSGIACYGVPPAQGVGDDLGLEPAMGVVAAVAFVQRIPAGDALSYGLRYRFEVDSTVATVPIGYADGVPRRLSEAGAEVLIGGRRRRIVGAVTMDQVMVDCGDDPVAVGDEVVLLGRQGTESVLAPEWARLLGTIPYEVLCGFGPRLPRVVESAAMALPEPAAERGPEAASSPAHGGSSSR